MDNQHEPEKFQEPNTGNLEVPEKFQEPNTGNRQEEPEHEGSSAEEGEDPNLEKFQEPNTIP